MAQNYTVIAIVEAKPEKINTLKDALIKVTRLSRAESSCIEFRLHQDTNNPAIFILYENWQSPELHQQQFQKPYILELLQQLDDLLAKPFQGFTAQEIC